MPDARHTPFVDEVRGFANDQFDRFYLTTGKDLDSTTPHADQEALNLLRTGLPAAIKEAQRAGHEMLALHFTELLAEVPRENTYGWLLGLAIDGRRGSMKPIGEVMDRIIAQVGKPI